MANKSKLQAKILEVLEAHCVEKSSYLSTSGLLFKADIPRVKRPTVLHVLHRLHDQGKVLRTGVGKFGWRTAFANKPVGSNSQDPQVVKVANWLESHHELKPAFSHNVSIPTHPILADLRKSLYDYGQLTDKQVALAHKLITEQGLINQPTKEATQTETTDQPQPESHIKKTVKIAGVKTVVPPTYFTVLDLAECRRNVLLIGPAGCGKTFLAKLIADTLGLEMGSISCTSGMSEAHLLGRAIPNLTDGKTHFQSTDFLRCYENGGLFLLDEIDAADPNLLLAINAAIANGYCNVPNRPDNPIAERHKDFVCIATANTFGRGANRVYAGRNQLDDATLDRFRIGIVECYYDAAIEEKVCPNEELRSRLQTMRTKIEAASMRRTLSTRFMEDAHIMMQKCNWPVSRIVATFLQGWSSEEIAKVN